LVHSPLKPANHCHRKACLVLFSEFHSIMSVSQKRIKPSQYMCSLVYLFRLLLMHVLGASSSSSCSMPSCGYALSRHSAGATRP
jgi:hypothetical protein